MNAIKRARLFIEQSPNDEAARVLSRLVLALEESEHSFELSDLYTLDMEKFDLALDILKEWRLDRYYAGKAKLFDISLQMAQLQQ